MRLPIVATGCSPNHEPLSETGWRLFRIGRRRPDGGRPLSGCNPPTPSRLPLRTLRRSSSNAQRADKRHFDPLPCCPGVCDERSNHAASFGQKTLLSFDAPLATPANIWSKPTREAVASSVAVYIWDSPTRRRISCVEGLNSHTYNHSLAE